MPNKTQAYLLILLSLIQSIQNSSTSNPQILLHPANKSARIFEDDSRSAARASGCHTNTDDPDTFRSAAEVIESRGYKALEYNVVTDDGYILTVQRIVNPLVRQSQRSRLKPVIMQHGLMASADDWVLNSVGTESEAAAAAANSGGENDPKQNSLGFYLANRGYDVFLANSRGNIYSRRHINMSHWDAKFWNFCFDQKIAYDLPATIKFVRKLTQRTKVAYVGHSQGAALMLGLMSIRPEYADIIEPFVALAPVAYVNNAISPFRHLDFLTPYWENKNQPFTASREMMDFLATRVCGREVVLRDICKNFIFLIVGFNEEELDPNRIPVFLCHIPSGTSLKNLAHYGQEIRSGRFSRFDLGLAGNMQKYGSRTPPDYQLANVRSKSMIFFTAENDWLASPKDVAHLIRDLRVKPYASINMTELMPLWNHIDFLYGKHTGQLINPLVYHYLERFRN